MSREVIFWGCGKIAKETYCKHKDEITLLYGISNDPTETLFAPEPGKAYPVKRPEMKQKTEDGMIIICSCDYKQIAEQLTLLGYIPFVDFIDYELANILWMEKKIVLLYGFCHLRGIADYLKETEPFLHEYAAIYYPNYLFLDYYQQERLKYLIDHCDVFVYGAALTQENQSKNEAILKRLKFHVKTLCLQAAFFGGYFPQKKRVYNDMNKLAVKCEGYDYTPFSYGDNWLNERIEEGIPLDDVLERIQKDEIHEKDFIMKYIEREWRRLKYQEQESDFKIFDYMEKNYRKSRLFRNETHMENQVIYQYASQLLRHLGYDAKPTEVDAPMLNCSQHFIYPCVAKALGLEWDVWKEKLDLYTYAGWKKVTMEEYIRNYYESCDAIRVLKKKKLLP